MTQPAKSQEPSMEEILASIRRIIADDDAGRIAKRASDAPSAPEASEAHDAFGQPAEPPRPSFSAPPEPNIPETPAETLADSAATSAAEENHASEILDLTEINDGAHVQRARTRSSACARCDAGISRTRAGAGIS